MTAPDYFVYDGDPENAVLPRVASVDDLGGDDKENDVEYPPDPDTMPCAEDHNQSARVVAAHSRVTTWARLDVRFSAGTPSVYSCACKGSALTTTDFTITDVSDGLTEIEWAAGALAFTDIRPSGLTITGNTAIDRARCYMVDSHTIRVYTALGATATDADFTIDINGEST